MLDPLFWRSSGTSALGCERLRPYSRRFRGPNPSLMGDIAMRLWKLTTMAFLALAGLATASLAAEGPSAYRFSDLKSLNVENNRGEKLGKIEDLIYDPQNGEIDYVVIGMGGFLGLGEKSYAVPAEALH